MTAPTVTLRAPPSGFTYHDPGILRPVSDIIWADEVGNVDLRFQWDTDSAFAGNTNEVVSLEYENATAGSYDLAYDSVISGTIQWDDNAAAIKAVFEAMANVHEVNVTGTGTVADPFLLEFQDPINGGRNVPDVTVNSDSLTGDTVALTIATQGVTGPPIDVVALNDSTNAKEQAPTSDLGLAGPWFWRVAVIDRDDGAGSWSAAQTLNYVDPIDYRRYLHLLENVGVAFHDTDEPAGGWGTGIGGTEGADGDITEDFRRYLYLLENVGVGFDPTDEPGGGWGTGGTEGPDGFTLDFRRYLYLLENVDATQPCPFLFSLSTPVVNQGGSLTVIGQGLVSATSPTADAWDAEVRLYESPSFAAAFVVMAITDYTAGSLEDTITVTVPSNATSGFVAVVHTTTPTCTGSNFIGLTVLTVPASAEAGWWVEVWNLRNNTKIISALPDVAEAVTEHIPGDIGKGALHLPANHPDIADILDDPPGGPFVQRLVKTYQHNRFAYAFVPDDIDEVYADDGARLSRIHGEGQETMLKWGRLLGRDFPANPTRTRAWLWGSSDNAIRWGDMESSNQLSNGDIEDAHPDPWEAVGTAALFATSAEAHSGIYSLRVTPTALNDGTEIGFSQAEDDGVFADVFTKVNTIGGTYKIEVLDSEDAVLDTFTWIPGSAAWLKTELSYVAAADETVRLRITQTAGPLTIFYVDDAVANTKIAGTLLAFRATARLSRTEVAAGVYSLEIACDAGGTTTFNGVEGFFTEAANQKYRLSVAVSGPAGDEVRFEVRLGGVLLSATQVLTGAPTFDTITLEGTAGPTGGTGRFTLRSNEAAALTFYADELKINPGDAMANPGVIVGDVHTTMVARGTLDFVTLGFDGVNDSAGIPWPEELAFQGDPRWTMFDLLDKLEGLGYRKQYAPIDWRGGGDTGWELNLYAPGNSGVAYDATEDGPAMLPSDTIQDASTSAAAPRETVVYGEGAGGIWSVAQLGAAELTALERREGFILNPAAQNSTTVFRAASHRLDVVSTRHAQWTAKLTDHGDPLPYFDFIIDDRLRAHLPSITGRDHVRDATYQCAAIVSRLTGGGRAISYQTDWGNYALRRAHLRDLLVTRLLEREATENYLPGTGSVSSPSGTGPGVGGQTIAAIDELHEHLWSEIEPADLSHDLGGRMPSPSVVGLRGRKIATAAPAAGEVLEWDAATALWTPRRAIQAVTVELSSNQAIATAGAFVAWDQEDSDSDAPAAAWAGANPTRLVAWQAGWYMITASLEWESTVATDRWITIVDNGAKSYGHQRLDMAGTNSQPTIGTAVPVNLAAGAYVEIFAGQDEGSNRNLLTGSHTRAAMVLLG